MGKYFADRNLKTIEKIRRFSKQLPDCCCDFLLGIEGNSSALTRLGYCYDMLTFFTFLQDECVKFDGKKVVDFTYQDVNRITDTDIEQYLSYLNGYKRIIGIETRKIILLNNFKGTSPVLLISFYKPSLFKHI